MFIKNFCCRICRKCWRSSEINKKYHESDIGKLKLIIKYDNVGIVCVALAAE